MKAFKPTFRDRRTGKKKTCSHYYLTFVDNRQIRRRLPAYRDKRASERLGQTIEEVLASGGIVSQELQRRLEALPEKQRGKLIAWQVIEGRRLSENLGKSLTEHVEDFKAALAAKGNTDRYVRDTGSKLASIFDACGFRHWSDVDANAVYTHLAGRRGDSGIGHGQRTFNAYLQAAKEFARWMIRERRASGPSPLEHLSPIRQTEIRRRRRALSVDELRTLLRVTQGGPERFGMTGPERAILYRVATETGLRANELRSLTVSSFDLTGNTVTVQAAYSKRRRLDVLPIRAETAADLRDFFRAKLPTMKAFGGTFTQLTDTTAEMIAADLADAGLAYCEDGAFFDFHSQRHETGTLLAAAGVDVKTAQSLMRHSDVNLTMSIYTHTLRGSEASAVAKLPDLSVEGRERALSA